jgi:hypothetical protein
MNFSTNLIALITISAALIIFWIFGLILTYHLQRYSLPQDKNKFISYIYLAGGVLLSSVLILLFIINF